MDIMPIAFIIVLVGFVLLGAYLTYLAWLRPDLHLRYVHWLAHFYDGWNPGQASWIRSPPFVLFMRIGNTVFFLFSLIMLIIVVLEAL
jgi:hypothetical protein